MSHRHAHPLRGAIARSWPRPGWKSAGLLVLLCSPVAWASLPRPDMATPDEQRQWHALGVAALSGGSGTGMAMAPTDAVEAVDFVPKRRVLIGHDTANERLLARLERRGVHVRALMQEHQLQVDSVRSSADELLLEVDARIKDAVDRGMPAVRVLGTLGWGRGTPGWPSDREVMRLEAHVTSAVERLPSIVVCTYDVPNLPGPMLVKGGFECHPLTFRRNRLRPSEHHVPPQPFLEDLSAG